MNKIEKDPNKLGLICRHCGKTVGLSPYQTIICDDCEEEMQADLKAYKRGDMKNRGNGTH